MSQILNFLQKKLIGDRMITQGDELNFFFNEYYIKAEPQDKKMIDGIRSRLNNLSLAGLFLGISLAFSLQRYTSPSKNFPFIKLLAGCALPMIGYGFCLQKGVSMALDNLILVRKKLLEKDDDVYYEYLSKKYNKYEDIYQCDYDIVSDLLTKDEFDILKTKSKKDFIVLFTPRFGKLYKGGNY